MKKTGQQTRFRDDLRRLLLFYSLLPVLSAVLLLIVFLGYIPLQNVVHGTADNLQLAWDAFGQEWQSLQNELLSLQSQLDLDAFRSSVNYQAAVKSRIYQFINQGVSRPQFFLLDADENLVFSSQTNEAMRESLQNSFHWRLVNNLPASAGKVAMVVARAEVGVSTVSSMLVGCCLYDEKGGVAGYLYFALDEDQMAAQFKQCASDLIVTDRFDSVFLGTNSAFVGDFGKLRVMLRDVNGFTMLPEGLFYIRTLTTQNGFLKIHAMSECGGIISTLLLLGALVLVDCIGRMVEGVLPSEECFTEESHWNGLLEYPQYTHPAEWNGRRIPDILLTGDHGKIAKWRHEMSLRNTLLKRPDLLEKAPLSQKDRWLLAQMKAEWETENGNGSKMARNDGETDNKQ